MDKSITNLKDLILRLDLFTFANTLYRNRRYLESYTIYAILSEYFTDLKIYEINKEKAYLKVRKMTKKTLPTILCGKEGYISSLEATATYLLDLMLTESETVDFQPDFNPVNMIASLMPESHRYSILANMHARNRNWKGWEVCVSNIFRQHDMTGIKISNLHDISFRKSGIDQIEFETIGDHLVTAESKLVTVFISAYNAQDTIADAINSLLNQTHKETEIIIIDDFSQDRTYEICQQFKKQFHNIDVMRNTSRKGTYYNRNVGLEKASGEFFTVLDADDIAHPRRIELQVHSLMCQTNLVGCIGNWIRITPRGYVHFRTGWGGTYIHQAVATFLFQTKPIRHKIGFWDELLFSADTEYFCRVKRIFGDRSIKHLSIPLGIASQISTSLTNNPVTGICEFTGLSDVRLKYQESWTQWHQQSQDEDLYLARDLVKRPFVAPKEMIP